MEVGRLEEEATAESLIPGHGLDDALGSLQHTVDDMRQCDRCAALRAERAGRGNVASLPFSVKAEGKCRVRR